jgi:hypothetical protein
VFLGLYNTNISCPILTYIFVFLFVIKVLCVILLSSTNYNWNFDKALLFISQCLILQLWFQKIPRHIVIKVTVPCNCLFPSTSFGFIIAVLQSEGNNFLGLLHIVVK